MIPIYKPSLSNYKKSANEAIDSEWISNHGMYTELASKKIRETLGIKYCILMNNGTSATHCIYIALKYKYPDIKKIYVPNNVFVAVWNCGLMVYDASVFELVKTNPTTLNMETSEEYIQSLDKGAAVVIAHNLGNVVNVPRLKRLRTDLIFIEDNCEGLFGKYEGQYTGSCEGTLASSASFYGNKTITTGEGGAFFTNDLDIYKHISRLYSHGMTNQYYIHDILAYNYRMTNIQAAFLYDQLNDLDTILKKKRDLFSNYKNLLADSDTTCIDAEPNTDHSTWMFAIRLNGCNYKQIETFMNHRDIQIRPLFYDVNDHKHLSVITNNENTVDISDGFMLPSFPDLTSKQQDYIVECIKNYN